MMWDDYLGDFVGGGDSDFGDIFDYDFTMGGGDPGFFDYNMDTSWIDNFDWDEAIGSLDFSNLFLPDFTIPSFDWSSLSSPSIYDLTYKDTTSIPSSAFSSGNLYDLIPEGSALPSLSASGDARALYEFPWDDPYTFTGGQGLQIPTSPGMTYLGSAQGLTFQTPEGIASQFGIISPDATPILGDPRSFINNPQVLGRDVFTTDFYRPESGVATVVDPKTGETRKVSQAEAAKIQADMGRSAIEKAVDKFVEKVTGGKDGKDGKGGSSLGGGKSGIDPLLAALLGGLLGLLNKPESKGPVGYQGGIPKYTATRGPAQAPTTGGRVPGGAGIPSLTGGVSYQRAAAGGLMGLASGGKPNPPRYLRGGTDGMADEIYTDIDGEQPARLSHGEYVISADVVSHLGNGNSDAGAKELDEMMDRVRQARTGTKKQGKQINPRKHLPV